MIEIPVLEFLFDRQLFVRPVLAVRPGRRKLAIAAGAGPYISGRDLDMRAEPVSHGVAKLQLLPNRKKISATGLNLREHAPAARDRMVARVDPPRCRIG